MYETILFCHSLNGEIILGYRWKTRTCGHEYADVRICGQSIFAGKEVQSQCLAIRIIKLNYLTQRGEIFPVIGLTILLTQKIYM